MLAEVRVRDLALLETVDVALAPGLNVISGETGEGKSLLLLAITLLLGARARKGLVRSGCREAVVEGRFVLDAESAARLGTITDLVPPGSEEVCLRRTVAEDGSSRAYLDGSLCPVGLLQKMGQALVDIHGQGEHQTLLRSSEQAAVLDRFGALVESTAAYVTLLHELRETVAGLRRIEDEASSRQERLEYLRYQARELRDAAPRPGEDAGLEAELRLLSRSTELAALLARAAGALAEDDGATGEACARFARGLAELAGGHSALDAVVERLRALGREAEDLGRTCSRLIEDLPSDPARQAEIDARLSLLRTLARRHRIEPEALAGRLEALDAEIATLAGAGERSEHLTRRREELAAQLWERGAAILSGRRRAARRLERAASDGLAELRMERASFRIVVEPEALAPGWDPLASGESGPGPVRFLVAANPGEPEQPLERVASGGEMARIMLALRGALAGAHRIPLLIFDEIDAGVGGRVGLPFGRRIAAIAKHHQVLVVTHLPQVAAFAGRHLRVRKRVLRGRTRTEVEVLDDPDRLEELAEMLGGEVGRDAARAQARALLREAEA